MRIPQGLVLLMVSTGCGQEERDYRVYVHAGGEEDARSQSLDANSMSSQNAGSHDHDENGTVLEQGPTPKGNEQSSPQNGQGRESNPSNGQPVTPTPNNNFQAIVTFRIASGTGSKSWNSEETTLNLKVGQTLVLVNDDTTAHRLHTNGAPCPHGAQIAPGQSMNCSLAAVFEPTNAAGPLYDHIAGKSAQFWLRVTK